MKKLGKQLVELTYKTRVCNTVKYIQKSKYIERVVFCDELGNCFIKYNKGQLKVTKVSSSYCEYKGQIK